MARRDGRSHWCYTGGVTLLPAYLPEAEVETEHQTEEHEIPQLLETGISADYRTPFLSYEAFAKKYGPAFLTKLPGPHRIKHYEEWFPAESYGRVVNEENRETVDHVNAIADELNAMMEEPASLEISRFIELCDQADALILGRAEDKAA